MDVGQGQDAVEAARLRGATEDEVDVVVGFAVG